MASLKYRCLTPNVQVEEHLVAASMKFAHEGAAFCYLDGSGLVTTVAVGANEIYGWVLVPEGMGAGSTASYWQSNSSGTDKVQVIVDRKARFLVPLDAAITRANLGDALDIATPPSNNGAQQTLDVATTDDDVARIVGLGTSVKGGTTTDAIVKIKTWQADT
ncbi:hypothetical protein LCGC14_2694490 [marine sediment metagenome]|uniref:Uncharacterized protein n=1 Tax=marine sediment metagenome TaxID=412755 RepID=A0A0F9C9A3_9ZZZZ